MPNTSRLAQGPMTHLQLAFDGQWESLFRVDRGFSAASELDVWLSKGSNNLAIEAFYPSANGPAFIGVRLSALHAERQHKLVCQLVKAFAAGQIVTVDESIEALAGWLEAPLFQSAPAFLELGKVNAWRSFGPVVFWPEQTGRTPTACLVEALAANPRYLEASTLPYAIEFGFDGQFPHWLGMPISETIESAYMISRTLAAGVLAHLG